MKISNVSETMLIPLYCRAKETLSANPVISDPKSVEILEQLKKEMSGSDSRIYKMVMDDSFSSKLPVTVSIRTMQFDRYVKNFLKKYPKAVAVNLGSGLDTRFTRVDNGRVNWYEVDFPEVTEARKQFFKENERYHFLPYSVLDFEWLKQIKEPGPFLFLAEGLFMYLQEEEVKALVLKLQESFPGSELVFEITHKRWVDKMKSSYFRWKMQRQLGFNKDVTFNFGVRDGRDFENWGTGLKFLDEVTYFDENEPKLGWFNLFGKIELFRKVQWIVHYKLG